MTGKLSVRKTLVLGIGSTGLDVCEQLAEHLTWQYGDFERAAWVRLLVLETAQPRSPLGDRVIWSGMRREEYVPYRTQPRSTGSEFGFYEWQDGPTLQDIDNPADGAGNCRMLGRLCFFHPRTYSNLLRRVKEDLSALEQVTPQAIANRLDEPGMTVEIDQGGTVVYIVGTLCGGTCSGAAADLGYLIDVWSGNKARRQAIFTLPHPALASAMAPRYKKNAYYALKELNHYQLSHTAWKQRLPGSDTPHVSTDRPYDILRVVMPAGPSDGDVRNLNAMIAQYLAAAVGPAGLDIAASDVDASSKMVGGESIGFMKPLFSTVGVAALEYPGEHIQRAATARLLAAALTRWTQHSLDTDAFRAALDLFGGAELEAIIRRLTQGTEGVALTPFQALFRNLSDGVPPTVEQVRQLLREVDARLTQQKPNEDPIAGALPLVQTLLANQERLLAQVKTDIERLVDQWLLDPEGGPAFVAEVIRRTIDSVEIFLSGMHDVMAASAQDTRTMREILDRQIDDIERSQRGFSFGKRTKLRRGWQALLEQLYTYLESETRTQALNHIQRLELLRAIGDQYRRTTVSLLRRLDTIRDAFTQEASEHDRRWRQLAASSPSINGKVYFDPEPPASRGTVTEEYYNLLRQRRYPGEPVTGWDEGQKELAAIRDVLTGLDGLREEVRRAEGQSAFDPKPGISSAREAIPAAILSAVSARARSFFTPLREQVHIADKASDADLATVVQMSEPRLGISAAQVSDQLSGVKGATPMLSYLAFMDMGPSDAEPRDAIARVDQVVRNSMELRRGRIIPSGDPFRLLVIREKHGFTMGQMEGVVRTHAYDHHALQSAEGCADFKFWHTRRDVDWVDPLTPPSLVDAVEEGWLLLILLGKPADPGITWLPATQGDIPAEGWYQINAGEYFVTYPPDVDASESGITVPMSYNAAIARLMGSDCALLRRTLGMRFSTYCNAVGAPRVVMTVDLALQSLSVFGLTDIDKARADRIIRRAYRRNDALTRAFFDYRTEGVGPNEFSHLKRLQGVAIEDRPGEIYPSDGYYCPRCHQWLGAEVQSLLESQFRCKACHTDERYWP